MKDDIVRVRPEADLFSAIEVIATERSGFLMVVDDKGGVIGMVGSAEIRRAFPRAMKRRADFEAAARGIRVSEVMAIDPITVEPSTPLHSAIALLLSCHLPIAPVVDGGRLTGCLTIEDILAHYGAELERTFEGEQDKPHRPGILQTVDLAVDAASRIVVASQNPFAHEVVVTPLEAHGYVVESARSLADLERLLNILVPDLLVLDPALGPQENLARLARNCPTLWTRTPTEVLQGSTDLPVPSEPDRVLAAVHRRLRDLPTDDLAPTSAARRVLVADDDHVIRRILARQLVQQGYEVDEADDGREAASKLKQGGYALVILDINMPFRSGLELLRDLASAGDRTPRLVLSASHKDETVIEAFELGADDFVRKPFNPGILMRRLERLVVRR